MGSHGVVSAEVRIAEVLDRIASMMRGITMRPGMYGDPCCLETQALRELATRRILLGEERDPRPAPFSNRGVYDTLLKKRFETSQTPAFCHLKSENVDLFRQRIADFIAEWWRLEQIAAPDPDRDDHINECRLFVVRERIAALPEELRHEAWSRIGVSYDSPEYAVKHYECKIDGNEVLWPDGQRFPIKIPTDRDVVLEIMRR